MSKKEISAVNRRLNAVEQSLKQGERAVARRRRRRPRRVPIDIDRALIARYGRGLSTFKEDLIPIRRLLMSGLSETGLQWAINVCDPAANSGFVNNQSAVGARNPGVPDLRAGTHYMHPQRWSIVIPPPQVSGVNVDWSLCIITTPFPEMPWIHIKKPVSDTRTWEKILLGSGGGDINGWTTPLNDPSSEMSFWYMEEYVGSGDYIAKSFDSVMVVSRATTSDLVGEILTRGGTVTSGQLPPNVNINVPVNFSAYDTTTATIRTGSPAVQWHLPVLGSDAIFQSDPLAAQRPAEQGDYNVLRIATQDGVPHLLPTLLEGELQAKEANVRAINNELSSWHLTSHHLMPNSDFNFGFTYYESIAATQSVRVKLHGFLEGIPYMGGPFAGQAVPTPPQDLAAVSLVAQISSSLPHSYPASYNDLGGLLGTIGRIIHGISGTLGKLPIPVVSEVANVVHGVLSPLVPYMPREDNKAMRVAQQMGIVP